MSEVEATEISWVPKMRMATVASQGRLVRYPSPPRIVLSEIGKSLCDSHMSRDLPSTT